MSTLSLCMIVKNEEENLNRCLSSCFSLFDEIIIVDTGSTDKTIEIAKKYTNKVFNFKWIDDFSKARNYGIKKATSDFFMWLDADDIITQENLVKLKELKQKLNTEDIIMLKYNIAFDENNKATFSYYRERICKNNGKFLFNDPVHEAIKLNGNIVYIDNIFIEHRKTKENEKGRNLKIYEKMIKNKIKFSPRQIFYYARELYFNNKINKAIFYFKKFLKSKNAFLENKIEACLNLSNCYLINKNLYLAKKVLFESFLYSLPRAEILCNIGYIYKAEADYLKAIYYFNLALNCPLNYSTGAFIKEDCYNYIPYLELCVCYYNLNNYEKAYYYNLQALKIKPKSIVALNNDKLLKQLLINKK